MNSHSCQTTSKQCLNVGSGWNHVPMAKYLAECGWVVVHQKLHILLLPLALLSPFEPPLNISFLKPLSLVWSLSHIACLSRYLYSNRNSVDATGWLHDDQFIYWHKNKEKVSTDYRLRHYDYFVTSPLSSLPQLWLQSPLSLCCHCHSHSCHCFVGAVVNTTSLLHWGCGNASK